MDLGKLLYRFRFILIVSVLIVSLLTFQNCSPVGETRDTASVNVFSSLSGGEAYDGKIRPGTYVQEVIQLGCDNLSPNERSHLVVDQNLRVRLQTSSPLDCQTETVDVVASSISNFKDTENYLAYQGGIFKNLDIIEKGWVTEIWCRPENGDIKFNFFADYSPESSGSIGRFDDGESLSENSVRNLVGTNLSYKTSQLDISIDLSAEVFLGARRYSGQLTKAGQTHEILCYAGSGVLPRTTSKEIDSSRLLMTDQYSVNNNKLSPDGRYFYSAQVDGTVLDIKILNVLNGKSFQHRISDTAMTSIYKVQWVNNISKEFVVVGVKGDSQLPLGSKLDDAIKTYQIIHFENGVNGLSVKNQLDIQAASGFQSGANNFGINAKGLVWANQKSGPSQLTFHSYDFNSQILQSADFDLKDTIEDQSLFNSTKFKFYGAFEISGDVRNAVFQLTYGESRKSIHFISIKSGFVRHLSPWFSINTWTKAQWVSANEFWLGNVVTKDTGQSQLAGHTLITEKYTLGESDLAKQELNRLDNYELYSITASIQNPNHMILVFKPDFHYLNSLNLVVIKYDLKNNVVISKATFSPSQTKQFFGAQYMVNGDSLVFGVLNAQNLYKLNAVHLGSGVAPKTFDVGISQFFDFSYQYVPQAQKDFLFFRNTNYTKNNNSWLHNWSVFEYEIVGKVQKLTEYMKGLSELHLVRETSRVLFLKNSNAEGFEAGIQDLTHNTRVNLFDRMNVPKDLQIYGVYPVSGSSSMVIQFRGTEFRSDGYIDSKSYIVTFDDL